MSGAEYNQDGKRRSAWFSWTTRHSDHGRVRRLLFYRTDTVCHNKKGLLGEWSKILEIARYVHDQNLFDPL